MHIGITLPGGSRMNVQPGHPSQQGLWAGTSMATLDTSQPGIHTITYRSVDAVGNMGTATRTVVVVADATLPFIAINGAHHLEHEAGKSFTDAGAVVTDADGNVLEANLEGQGNVDTNTPGEYSLTYDFTDGAGKAAVQVVRKVTVIDNAAPVVVLKPHPTFGGTDIVKLFAGQAWEDPGIEVTDFDSSTWSVSSSVPASAGCHCTPQLKEEPSVGHGGTGSPATYDEETALSGVMCDAPPSPRGLLNIIVGVPTGRTPSSIRRFETPSWSSTWKMAIYPLSPCLSSCLAWVFGPRPPRPG